MQYSLLPYHKNPWEELCPVAELEKKIKWDSMNYKELYPKIISQNNISEKDYPSALLFTGKRSNGLNAIPNGIYNINIISKQSLNFTHSCIDVIASLFFFFGGG